MSVFLETNHLFLRSPVGGVEDVALMAAAGFGAIFCNIGDYDPSEWGLVRDRALYAGVVCGPWLRTSNGHEFDPNRLALLVDTAQAWGSPLIANCEKELDYTGDDLTGYIAEQLEGLDAAISMEVRPFGSVDWTPLAALPVLPQSFPAETGIYDSDADIRARWQDAGMRCVVITYGSYGGMTADEFLRLTPYGVYTADDCGNDFQAWAPLGSVEACAGTTNGGEDVEKIGNQDGIVAEYNALRDLDPSKTLLVKDAVTGKWPDISTLPSDLSKWKAFDKGQRRSQILKDDHDAQAAS